MAITSCGKKIDCLPSAISITFTEYDTLESDTIIITSYSKENNFNTSHSIDTIYLKNTLNQNYSTSITNDTASIIYMFIPGNNSEANGYLNSTHNWVIITKNNTYTLTDFKYETITKRCGLFECFPCYVPINELKLNNSVVTPNEQGLLYLKF